MTGEAVLAHPYFAATNWAKVDAFAIKAPKAWKKPAARKVENTVHFEAGNAYDGIIKRDPCPFFNYVSDNLFAVEQRKTKKWFGKA